MEAGRVLSDPEETIYKFINIIWLCSNLLAMSNSCYNPFIYALLNERFKNGFRSLVPYSRCGRKPDALNTNFSTTKYTHERPNVTMADTVTSSSRGRPTQHVHVTVDGKHIVGVSV
ncbi:hypothetical protein LSH36_290g01004 [Paralvinella palmiformis]|uniref:Uncharacterized protein n=1 Tax=Paralvinella palmiformis TaxID=53620 RepID=A0AAD9JJK7_9ANNE|nr:hypothetical protein LSH36_290g01004 [Paralvinella palmiformis]